MSGLLQDLRFALRQLRKSPGFTAVAVITLALGIGLNVAIFSIVDEVTLHPMPVREANRIVNIFTSNPSNRGEIEQGGSSYPDFLDLRANSRTLAGVAALDKCMALMDDGVQNKMVLAAVVSENFFDVLEATPALGRMFTEKEFQTSPAPSVMLSHPFWQRQFNGDATLPGRTIVVDGQPVTVLGVLPRGFRGPVPGMVPDLWIPMPTWQQLTGERGNQADRGWRDYELYGRLREGVSLQQAKAELGTVAAALASSYPASNNGRRMTMVLESETRGGFTFIGLLLLGIAALVLLIACANVAGLLIARGEYRRKEIATRLALGGSRGKVIRQLLTETALLAASATLAALLLGNFILHEFPMLLPPSLPIVIDAHLNLRALLFALAAALASSLFFGLVPALQSTRIAPAAVLKQSGGQDGAGRRRLRSALVVTQVAFSLAVVVCSGLLTRSVIKMLVIDPGFNAHQNMLIMELGPDFAAKSDEDSKAFARESRQRLQALPGVTAITIARSFPFGLSHRGFPLKVFSSGRLASAPSDGAPINFASVGDEYFSVMGTRIVRGRAIEQHDLDANAHVMVVNQAMAGRFWPNGDPLGQRVRLERADGDEYEVIGVAEDGKYDDVSEDRRPYFFLPMKSEQYDGLSMAVKTSIDPKALAPAVRQTLREISRDVPITSLVTLREHMRDAFFLGQLIAELTGVMGGLALLLAAVGLYGLMAFMVGRRTWEIGVRMALGAQPKGIFRLVIGHALRLTAIGAAIGVAGAVTAAQVLREALFGVAPTDLLTIALSVVVLAAVAFAAAAVPARRAAKVDPMVALRYE